MSAGPAHPETLAGRDRGLPEAARDYLAQRHGAAAGELKVTPLAGDASTRRYFRVARDAAREVLALYPEPFVAGESPFLAVRALLHECGLPVPEVLAVDGARGVVLLEDLGDVTLQEALRGAGPRQREGFYREALRQLARLQERAARAPQQAACFRTAFDLEKLSWELHYFQKHFLEGHRGCDLGVQDRATLAECFHELCAEIASWPRVLCHRDFHSRNLMVPAGRLCWIDFQDARLGPSTYDLASLLRDSYVELDEDFVAERCEEFRQLAVPGEARALFERRFELMSVQRNLKALGTFGFMHAVRGSELYLPYIPRTLHHARRNLARHPELQALRRVLAHYVEELQ